MVVFIPDCEWKVVKDTDWTVDNWGLDHARVLYCGRRDKKQQFEDSIVPFASLSNYPKLRLSGWGNSGGTISVPGVELEYVGFRSGIIPPPKPQRSVSVGSVNASGTDTTSGKTVSGTILFKASRTTWTWFETQVPNADNPRYTDLDNPSAPTIIGYSGLTRDDGDRFQQINYVSASVLAAITNALYVKDSVTDYQVECITPNALYACSSTIELGLASN